MDRFKKSIFALLEEGQELSMAEIVLVNQIIQTFFLEYKKATGEDPKPIFGTIYLIAPRLEEYGFILPRVEKWQKEDTAMINWFRLRKRRYKKLF